MRFLLGRLQVLLEIFGEGDLYTPAFLRKSAEEIDWKGIAEHSWSKERQEREKEREGSVPKWEKRDARRGKAGFGGAVVANSQDKVARKR